MLAAIHPMQAPASSKPVASSAKAAIASVAATKAVVTTPSKVGFKWLQLFNRQISKYP